MPSFFNRPFLTVLCSTVLGLAGMTTPMLAGDAPSHALRHGERTLEMRSSQASAGIGVTWGHGVVHVDGRSFAFRSRGLTLGQVGGSYARIHGRVHGLERIEDFAGTYAVAEAGATVGAGRRFLAWRN